MHETDEDLLMLLAAETALLRETHDSLCNIEETLEAQKNEKLFNMEFDEAHDITDEQFEFDYEEDFDD